MHVIKIYRDFPKFNLFIVRRYSQPAVYNQSEYTDRPHYPPILDLSLQSRKLRERKALHKKIQQVPTVEAKQIALNMPRYYGWRCVMFNEDKIPYNALPLVQCFTRTHLKLVDKLPDFYNASSLNAEAIVKEIKSLVENAIAIETEGVERHRIDVKLDKTEEQQKENILSKYIVKQINRIICNNISDKAPHILATQVDYDPRHEAFWFVGGLNVPHKVYNWRKQYPWLRDRLTEPIDTPIQYIGNPLMTLRHHLPLQPLVPFSEAANPEFKVPNHTYRPENLGYFTDFRHGTNIPGFWPGDYDEFGLMSIHGRGHILSRRESFGQEDNLEALHCQALKASFGWLLAQANYQGFTTFNDLTYPLVTQTIITNGQLWSLYAYQLNTVVMHNEQIDENPKHNICFGTKPMKLYESIENGQVKGLNEELLQMIVQFYLNSPEKRDQVMKPYLGKEVQVVADIVDDNKRCWLEERYKHLVSNRPRHSLLPELYMWERIYKINFSTRFMEARRRPFELGINPFKRRLNEHLAPYIPKAVRPYPRHGKKFETTYYPKV